MKESKNQKKIFKIQHIHAQTTMHCSFVKTNYPNTVIEEKEVLIDQKIIFY